MYFSWSNSPLGSVNDGVGTSAAPARSAGRGLVVLRYYLYAMSNASINGMIAKANI
jgi:hypothetical protein